ncbi:hypothetical protein HPB52_015655 [Rhipicephalus sanguineus]|uniref:Uncharacterized protein n=1 Tax=Rhipicephalus sanguineus TaxID=34632 RepID=A0A9D4PXT0_RHISA|nr:hypothetical protein HPB52_015655 [Rhipicephalus sanguineus]
MADAEAENKVKSAIEVCATAQAMIDINSEHLEGLRTRCETSAELTQHEIRALETKLIKLFSRQVLAKRKCSDCENASELKNYPKLLLWLKVVGLTPNSIQGLSNKFTTFDDMLEKPEQEIKGYLSDVSAREEEKRRFLIAMRNLKTYTERQLRGVAPSADTDLHWDSWDRAGVSHLPRRTHTSVPSEELCSSFGGTHLAPSGGALRPPTTPPASRRRAGAGGSPSGSLIALPDALPPLTKSRSHEAHLENRLDLGPDHNNATSRQPPTLPNDGGLRRRLATEPGLELANCSPLSPSRSPPFVSPDQQGDACFVDEPATQPVVPRSPRMHGMAHAIHHRFTSSVKVTTCQQCDKAMFFGYKCKECKFRCHRDCMEKVPPSCGLPNELVDVFAEHIQKGGMQSPNHAAAHLGSSPLHGGSSLRSEGSRGGRPAICLPPFHGAGGPDSSSSSCNSSTPSSPAFLMAASRQNTPSSASRLQQFHFPGTHQAALPLQKRNLFLTAYFCYHLHCCHLGSWHGSVAVKMLNMDHIDDRKTLETFKQEVATFRKTRHENLVLFMGACMKPPKLAIITSLCKGMTLYRHIHLRKDKFNLNRISGIALQICQGMGYLHARGIVHKDLKTKNIFYENGKVVITDFGLFSVTKLCQGNRKGDWLTIPQGWLCYLAPEVVRCLRADNQHDADDLPFATASDIYAFGTVWYELLCGEWPFRGQPSESIIWQVAKGIKQSLANIQASQDIKDFLMVCWSYKPQDRPAFAKLQVQLQRLPKKRLARSPSHPTHLSRSAESAF